MTEALVEIIAGIISFSCVGFGIVFAILFFIVWYLVRPQDWED